MLLNVLCADIYVMMRHSFTCAKEQNRKPINRETRIDWHNNGCVNKKRLINVQVILMSNEFLMVQLFKHCGCQFT